MHAGNTATWPGWETVRRIGQGSFGAVYEMQRVVGNEVEKAALKVVSISPNDSRLNTMDGGDYDEEKTISLFGDHKKSIEQEYLLMRKMRDCPNIVHCDDVQSVQHADGIGWDILIKMELLTPLTGISKTGLSEEKTIKLGRDICNALVECNARKILHRDIKPENIFVSDAGEFKLGDFGVAKTVESTMHGTVTGTYGYMAPEVHRFEPYGHTADIYSLGLVMYCMLNQGRLPFSTMPPKEISAPERADAQRRRISGEQLPTPAQGSERLKEIVLKACAFAPKARYQSAVEMLRDLDDLSAEAQNRRKEEERRRREWEEQERLRKEQEEQECLRREQERLRRKQEERELEHERKKPSWLIAVAVAIVSIAVVCLIIFIFSKGSQPEPGQIHIHSWVAAKCETPRTCSGCGQTEGMVLGHNWQAENCDTPKTCTACGKQFGTPLGHSWTSESCTATCDRCGAKNDVEHVWSELSSNEGCVCSLCGDIRYYYSINCTDVTLELGQTFRLELTNPNNENEEVQGVRWTASSNRVSISGDTVTAVAPGNAMVFVEYEGRMYSCVVRVRLPRETQSIAAGSYHTVGLKSDGTVVAVGDNDCGNCNVDSWTDIVAIAAGAYHTVGLKSDGTVVAVGHNGGGRCDVDNWTDIVAIATGGYHTVGLKSDGTVVAVGSNERGQCDVDSWTDIVAIAAGECHTVGLKSDGTVVAVGYEAYGRCDVDSWTDIVAIAAGSWYTVGLKSDGTVVAVGYNDCGQCDVDSWTDIVSITVGSYHTVGLKSDGTVVAVGNGAGDQCNVAGWTDIVAIAAGSYHTVGLKSDGTVVAVGNNGTGACDVSDWEDIKIPD